jgi:hypothetical protein
MAPYSLSKKGCPAIFSTRHPWPALPGCGKATPQACKEGITLRMKPHGVKLRIVFQRRN